MKETAILINTKDRPTELAMLLLSLRNSDYRDFDIYILDDNGGTLLNNYHFLNCIINTLKCEGNDIFIKKSLFNLGVSRARQEIVDWALKRDYKYLCRLDDDVIIEKDYLDRLIRVIDLGYDFATGVTIPMYQPTMERDPIFLKGLINRVIFDDKGNIIYNGDDCGIPYLKSFILPADHFRSCGLYKREIHNKVSYYPTRLSMHGFREEQIFSFKMIINGFLIGCDTQAITLHQITPSGGERPYTNNLNFNQEMFEIESKEMFEKYGNFIEEYHKKFNSIIDLSEDEYKKENNLIWNK
jgi:GT2 family glycosyltransferase